MYLELEHSFPLVGCVRCKHQYPHNSTDSEAISLNAGLRIDRSLDLDLWDVVVEVLRWSNSTKSPNPQQENCLRDPKVIAHLNPNKRDTETVDQVFHVDHVTTNRTLRVCSQIVFKCWYLARIRRLGILWSVHKLARAVTKWTRACDRRLACLISYTCLSIVIWETRLRIVRSVQFQESGFAGGTLRTLNHFREEYVSSEVEHLLPKVDVQKSKR